MRRMELEQLRHLPREIKQLQKELERVPIVGDTVKDYRTGYGKVITIFGFDKVKGERLNQKLKAKVATLQEQVEEMENWLDGIEDSEMRQIIRLRYRGGMSWQQIAFEIGKYDESYPRRKADQFLKLAEKTEMNALR